MSGLSRLRRVQQTQFAFSDTLAKALQTSLPEQSFARGKDRYDRFLKSAAASMINGPHPWLRDDLEQWPLRRRCTGIGIQPHTPRKPEREIRDEPSAAKAMPHNDRTDK